MIKFKKGWPLKSASVIRLHPRLEGERVYLRAPQWQDYDQWTSVRFTNQEFLKPYEPKWSENALSEDFFKQRLEQQNKEVRAGRGAFFLIFHRQNGTIIGGFNLNNIQYGAAHFASLGYWLDEKYLKQGYMHESAQLAIKYAFTVLRLNRLNAACLPDNEASINVLLKLGFEEEGLAKKYLQINGKFQDHRLFGLNNPQCL